MRATAAWTVAVACFAAACGLLGAACGPTGAPAPAGKSEPLAGHGAVAPRDTPAPHLAWQDNAFVTDTLPASARAGELVVVALRDHDGGRGFPNLKLEVRDRSDQVIQTIAVLAADDYERLAPAGAASPALQDRIAAANRELAQLHGLHDLVAMHPLEIQQPEGAAYAHLAMGDGLDVDWNGDHLHVFRHNQDRPVTTRDGHAWLAKPGVRCKDCDVCDNPAFLRAAYHAPDLGMIVAQIAYRGTDTCVEPPDQFHVVAW